jgi:hypothetical protein
VAGADSEAMVKRLLNKGPVSKLSLTTACTVLYMEYGSVSTFCSWEAQASGRVLTALNPTYLTLTLTGLNDTMTD